MDIQKKLDMVYIKKWVTKFGLQEEYQSLEKLLNRD